MEMTEKQTILLRAKDWVAHKMPETLKIPNDSYSKILILSTIDCFAQMWANYPTSGKNRATFTQFVLKYSSQRDTLKQVCPTTLYYSFLPDKTLCLQPYRIYEWDDPDIKTESDRLLEIITDKKTKEKAVNNHRYIKLLYQLRSKLVHELNNIGTKIEFNEDKPSIASGIDGKGQRIWTLNYPKLWLYNLAQEVIFNFIDDCLNAEELLRFLENKRNIDLTWYD